MSAQPNKRDFLLYINAVERLNNFLIELRIAFLQGVRFPAESRNGVHFFSNLLRSIGAINSVLQCVACPQIPTHTLTSYVYIITSEISQPT